MLRELVIVFQLFILFSVISFGQENDTGAGFQKMMITNPSLAGTGNDGEIRLSYLDLYPGNGYNFHSVYFSYDSYFSQIHGGACLYLTDDYLGGIVNDLHTGVSYAYFLKAGKNLFINAGLTASVYHRGFNFSGAVLPDQIDAFGGVTLPSGENLSSAGITVFDVGTGFVFTSGKFSGGFSISHLAEPDLSSYGDSGEKLKRKLLAHLTGDFFLNKTNNLRIAPLVYFEAQSGFINGGGGASIESSFLSINSVVTGDSGKNMNIQAGFAINTGRLSFYYNYKFNVISGNNYMPFSLVHQAGLSFVINNVEKRNINKTINFPKM